MRARRRGSNRVLEAIAILAVVALPLVAGVAWFSWVDSQAESRAGLSQAAQAVGTPPTDPASTAATGTAESSISPAYTTKELSAVTTAPPSRPPTATAAGGPPASTAGASLEAYRGLASWVDIYDDKAWADPVAAVRDMAGHGTRTLFLETSNAKSSFSLKDPPALRTFIKEAHARGMLVVAWYRPDIGSGPVDYQRSVDAIRYKSPDGQTFDGFALDIETSRIKSVAERNRALETLSRQIRRAAGPSYALGAIIPSPTGLARPGSYWGDFPYTMLAGVYDVMVPMSYYTWHGSGASAAYDDTVSNVRILRAQKGCAKIPIHLIGGLADGSSSAEVEAFVRASNTTGCIGAGLYSWPDMTSAQWKELRAVRR